ncbi:Armadillo Repeat-Containing Protein 4 [Manis pentadactyla]|nr:Armadillo Repeat-Containing Protein 4 [Manis pentadactyla]
MKGLAHPLVRCPQPTSGSEMLFARVAKRRLSWSFLSRPHGVKASGTSARTPMVLGGDRLGHLERPMATHNTNLLRRRLPLALMPGERTLWFHVN